MVQKEELHLLIKSLTKSKKRYFKFFCKRESSGSNYLKLFDAIDQQDEYDEAAIKQQFQREKFVKQLHVTKNYLRKAILKSLRNYHAGVSRHAELKEQLFPDNGESLIPEDVLGYIDYWEWIDRKLSV